MRLTIALLLILLATPLQAGQAQRLRLMIALQNAKHHAAKTVVVSKPNWTPWKKAQESHKPTVVFVTNPPECAPCQIIERDVLTDQHVLAVLNTLQVVLVSDQEGRRLWGGTVPQLIFVDSNWTIRRRVPAPTNPVDFLRTLELFAKETH